MRVARKAQAAQFAANVLPIIREVQAAGYTSFNAIAGQLNARKVATAKRWAVEACAGATAVEDDGGLNAQPLMRRNITANFSF
jgi:hypothetical protein